MKKLIAFAILLSLVSEGSWAQNYGLKATAPGTTGIVKKTGTTTTAIATPGVDYATPSQITKAGVGLGSVDNTADVNKTVAGDVGGNLGATVVNKIKGRAVASTAPTNGQAYIWNNSTSQWEPGTVAGGSSLPSQTGNNGKYLFTDGTNATWQNVSAGGNTGYTAQAYSSSVNVSFTGNNVDLTNVTGNFLLTGTNLTSGATRALVIHKTTASPVVVSIDQSTLPAPSIKPNTSVIQWTAGAPPTLTINGASGSVYILFIQIQGASGSFIPDIQAYQLGSENAINVTANYNTIGVDHTMHTAANSSGEQILAQIPLPANTLPGNSYLVIDYVHGTAFSGNSGNVQAKVRIGPPGLTNANINTAAIIDDYSNSNSGAIRRKCWLNVISTTLQTIQNGYSETNHVFPQTRTFDLSTDLVIYFTQEKQINSADAASLGLIKVEAGNK